MTDLEITKLCAEAMGYVMDSTIGEHSPGRLMTIGLVGPTGHIKWDRHYDPLHDDAQAMALVKKFRLDIYGVDADAWGVQFMFGPNKQTSNADLNRAICECVAKMEQSRKLTTAK